MGIFDSILNTIYKTANLDKSDALEPIEGVSFEDWAAANAKLASGIKTEELIKSMGIDMPRWDRVNNEWLTRMKNDKTYTLAMKYSAVFNNNASGNLPNKKDINENTYPFEKYVEVIAAMDVLGRQGRDAQDVLKDFGLTAADYSNLSSFWSKKIMFSPLTLGTKMSTLLVEYQKKYEKQIGTQNEDIQF